MTESTNLGVFFKKITDWFKGWLELLHHYCRIINRIKTVVLYGINLLIFVHRKFFKPWLGWEWGSIIYCPAQPWLGFLPKSISRLGSLELGKGPWEGFDGVPFVRVIKDFLLNKEVTSRALKLEQWAKKPFSQPSTVLQFSLLLNFGQKDP